MQLRCRRRRHLLRQVAALHRSGSGLAVAFHSTCKTKSPKGVDSPSQRATASPLHIQMLSAVQKQQQRRAMKPKSKQMKITQDQLQLRLLRLRPPVAALSTALSVQQACRCLHLHLRGKRPHLPLGRKRTCHRSHVHLIWVQRIGPQFAEPPATSLLRRHEQHSRHAPSRHRLAARGRPTEAAVQEARSSYRRSIGRSFKRRLSSPAKVQTESKRAGRDDTGGGDSTVLLSNRSAVSDANPKQLPANGAAAPTHADLNPASMANSADVKTTESLARVESLASASDHVVLPATSSAPAALPLADSTALAGTAVAVAVPLPGPGPVPLSAPVLAPVPTQVSVAVALSASSAAPAPAACAPAPAACAPAPAACAPAPAACAPAPASETAKYLLLLPGRTRLHYQPQLVQVHASSLPAPPVSISTGLSATTSEASSAPPAQLVTPRTAAAAEASIIEAVLTPRQVKVTQSTAGIPSPVLDLQASIEDDPVADSEVGSSRRASEESAINDLSSLTANVASIPTASIEAPDNGRTALSDGTLLPIALQPVVLPAGSSRVVHTKVPMLLLPPPGASLDADGLSGPVAARAAPRLDPSCSAEVTGQSSEHDDGGTALWP